MPRSKYKKQENRYSNYSRKRRKLNKEKRIHTRSLLHLLNKLIGLSENIENQHKEQLIFPEKYIEHSSER